MDEITNSIKELRKNLDSKLDSCITREKAERIIEDIITKLHPAESKAVIPSGQNDILEKFAKFSAKNSAESPWQSEYGRKFGCMKNFLLAAKNRHSILNDFKGVMSEGPAGNTGGGYLVPTEFSAEVIRIMNEASPIMQIANIIPMSSWKRQIPKQMSNLQVGWVAENGVKGISNPAFGQIEQTAKVLATVIKCTDELIRDSAINLTRFLSELVAEAMALEIERVALTGSLSEGDPFNGILSTPGLKSVAMAGGGVSFDDIANLIFSLSDSEAKDGVIVLSRAGLNKLMKLKDSNGNYIWSPPSLGSPATIWNTPYVVSSQIPNTVASASDLTGGEGTIAFFGRFNKNLLISPREDMTLKVSQDAASWNAEGDSLESAFMMDQTWLRFTQALSVDITYGSAFSSLIFK